MHESSHQVPLDAKSLTVPLNVLFWICDLESHLPIHKCTNVKPDFSLKLRISPHAKKSLLCVIIIIIIKRHPVTATGHPYHVYKPRNGNAIIRGPLQVGIK